MPTSLIVPAIGAAVSGAANMGISSLLGGNKSAPQVAYTPPGLNAGGLSATFGDNGYNVTASGDRMAAVGNVAQTFGDQASTFAGLRSMVAPGNNALLQARLAEIENARSSAIGNLRENLQRRRVLGSSFAQDAATRAEAEFGQQRSAATADTFMRSLEASSQLAEKEFTARRGQFQTGLDEMNLETNLAAGLATKATDVLGQNARYQALLDAQNDAGRGQYIGQTFKPLFGAIDSGVTKGLTGLFAGTSGSGGGSFSSAMPTNI